MILRNLYYKPPAIILKRMFFSQKCAELNFLENTQKGCRSKVVTLPFLSDIKKSRFFLVSSGEPRRFEENFGDFPYFLSRNGVFWGVNM